MKKKKWFIILGIVVLLLILFIPGLVKFIGRLREMEQEESEPKFLATVLEINDTTVTVEPLEFEPERSSSDRISFDTAKLWNLEFEVGNILEITYVGDIGETEPATIEATDWDIATDLRPLKYEGEWLNQDIAIKDETTILRNVVITEVYEDCFFVTGDSGNTVKVNGKLGKRWCVGDSVKVFCKNAYLDVESWRREVQLVRVGKNNDLSTGIEIEDAKPVIYLYPKKPTEVSVQLDYSGNLTCTYPAYNNGWKVTAHPDGTLTDKKGQSYNYLYWEGVSDTEYDFSKGFCVKGQDTAAFLEDVLAKLGLTRKEANEFIVYWLPLMEQNPYNIISFQTDIYTDAAKLTVKPEPDTVIRVFMAWQESDSYVEMKEQTLTAPERVGFTVVEWGGAEAK